jgi:hypothetical protein
LNNLQYLSALRRTITISTLIVRLIRWLELKGHFVPFDEKRWEGWLAGLYLKWNPFVFIGLYTNARITTRAKGVS